MYRSVLTLPLVALCALAQEKPPQAPQRAQASRGQAEPAAAQRPAPAGQAQPPPAVATASGLPPYSFGYGAGFGVPLVFGRPYFPGLPGFNPYDAIGFNTLGDFFQPVPFPVLQQGADQPGGLMSSPATASSPLQQTPPTPLASSASRPVAKVPPLIPSVSRLSTSKSAPDSRQEPSPQGGTSTAPTLPSTQGLAATQVPPLQLANLQAFAGFGGQPLGDSFGSAPGQGFPAVAGNFYSGYLPAHGIFGPGF
ncbi:proline-rich protein 36-like [Bacillus rossius redtenbacheri]|uniref:proline-rich protein 36-like n=1 Tax=Bacillus rossius redtenbacheri TaxID=93214 RepID=UPI002FDD129B